MPGPTLMRRVPAFAAASTLSAEALSRRMPGIPELPAIPASSTVTSLVSTTPLAPAFWALSKRTLEPQGYCPVASSAQSRYTHLPAKSCPVKGWQPYLLASGTVVTVPSSCSGLAAV